MIAGEKQLEAGQEAFRGHHDRGTVRCRTARTGNRGTRRYGAAYTSMTTMAATNGNWTSHTGGRMTRMIRGTGIRSKSFGGGRARHRADHRVGRGTTAATCTGGRRWRRVAVGATGRWALDPI